MKITLYVLPASHPCLAIERMLELKQLSYRRVELPAGFSGPIVRALRFPGRTVPAMRVDGGRIQGSVQISRVLEELQPVPPLFPDHPELRRRVEGEERWGEEVLQAAARRIEIWTMRRDRRGVASRLSSARSPIPASLAALLSGPFLRRSASRSGATDEAVRRDLAELPAMLDHVGEQIAAGTLGGQTPNAADFQIAASLALLLTVEQLREGIDQRPAGRLPRRLVSHFPGHVGPVLPAAWLRPLAERA